MHIMQLQLHCMMGARYCIHRMSKGACEVRHACPPCSTVPACCCLAQPGVPAHAVLGRPGRATHAQHPHGGVPLHRHLHTPQGTHHGTTHTHTPGGLHTRSQYHSLAKSVGRGQPTEAGGGRMSTKSGGGVGGVVTWMGTKSGGGVGGVVTWMSTKSGGGVGGVVTWMGTKSGGGEAG